MTVQLLANSLTIASGAEPLEALAIAREHLIKASIRLRDRPSVTRVGTGTDCRGYRSASMFETYVEAELNSGSTLTWWIEITWDHVWRIASRIYRDDDDGHAIHREFADRVAPDPAIFSERLAEVVEEVIASIDHRLASED